jgi:hypothetical protein
VEGALGTQQAVLKSAVEDEKPFSGSSQKSSPTNEISSELLRSRGEESMNLKFSPSDWHGKFQGNADYFVPRSQKEAESAESTNLKFADSSDTTELPHTGEIPSRIKQRVSEEIKKKSVNGVTDADQIAAPYMPSWKKALEDHRESDFVLADPSPEGNLYPQPPSVHPPPSPYESSLQPPPPPPLPPLKRKVNPSVPLLHTFTSQPNAAHKNSMDTDPLSISQQDKINLTNQSSMQRPPNYVIEQEFKNLMISRGWTNLPEQARRQIEAYNADKKWTLVYHDKLAKKREDTPLHDHNRKQEVDTHHLGAFADKDIPPDARWTKIDRKLVNPEALEEAKERFEERQDVLIVLRVLTKEEIQTLTDRTHHIREAREHRKQVSILPILDDVVSKLYQ